MQIVISLLALVVIAVSTLVATVANRSIGFGDEDRRLLYSNASTKFTDPQSNSFLKYFGSYLSIEYWSNDTS
jgi:hypothetical protein